MSAHPLEQASREVYWNITHPLNQVAMYVLAGISMLICFWGLWQRYQLWAGGLEDSSRLNSYGRRFGVAWDYVLKQRGVNRARAARIFHTLIVTGFVVLLFATTVVFIHQDLGILAEHFFGTKVFQIFHGRFYLAVSLLADIFGLLLIFGLSYAFYRRYILKPDLLHSSRADALMLGLLLLLCLQGFAIEGLRIAVTDDPWAKYSPVGYLFSLPFWDLSEEVLRGFHYLLWWFHAITVFAFFALLPYTKFLHMITSSANLFFREIDRPKGAMSYPGDIESIMMEAMESDTPEDLRLGVASLEDTSWKQRLDFDACTQCGRCQDICPAYNSGKILSPKWLMIDSRDHMLSLQAQGKLAEESSNPLTKLDRALLRSVHLADSLSVSSAENGGASARASNELVQHSAKSIGDAPDTMIAGGVLDEDVFWSCTSCRACMEVCPVGIEHVDYIMDVRRNMALMQGNIPSEAQTSLRAIETRGNPFGPAEDRIEWAEGLEVPVVEAGDEVDVLYWVGCISAYDKRKQDIARSLVRILNASGLSWGILGSRENCTGDPARRLGEENLFQTMAKKNIDVLKEVKFKTMVANCPHCFNTMQNEYPQVGSFAADDVRIVHHSKFIKELLADGSIVLTKDISKEITFHDPCYLGRYNDQYDEPRDVLVQLGGAKLTEMKDSKERGMCCGAGGGHFWMDMKVGERINSQRVDQAAATGASTVATGCPFCLQMMEDGVKMTDREGELEVKDIAELVAEAMR